MNEEKITHFYWRSLRVLFWTASNTVGDLSFPDMAYFVGTEENNFKYKEDHPHVYDVMAIMTWTVYWLTVYVMYVMMMNFVIANMG